MAGLGSSARVVLLVLAAAAVAAGFGLGRLSTALDPSPEAALSTEAARDDPATARDRALLLAAQDLARGMAASGLETAEILYRLHQPVERLKVDVPPDGVLDTALGLSPQLLRWPGAEEGVEVMFEIGRVDSSGEVRALLRRRVELGTGAARKPWHPVRIDLAEDAGRSVELIFRKSVRMADGSPGAPVFELDPADLVFWRLPRVRPRRLETKNVLLISLDTLRADHLGFMGYGRDTSPNLDRLAGSSVVFNRCFSQAPWTTPSHFSILTGTLPATHRAVAPFWAETRTWNAAVPHLAEMLREAGYLTGAFTTRGAVSPAFGFFAGHDFYNETTEQGGTDVEEIFAKAAGWIEQHADRSFYLFLHTYEPHWPFIDRHFVDAEGIAADDPAFEVALYDGDIRRADLHLGKVLDALERAGLRDETLIVVTSDHGEEFAALSSREIASPTYFGHGHTLYDDLLHVPLVIAGMEDGAGAGRTARVDAQVRSIDILPTLLDALGLAAAGSVEGVSLLPWISGERADDLPSLSGAPTYGTERVGLRDGGWKYIRRLSYGHLAHSPGHPLTPPHELYDLGADPGETRNLAKERPEMLETLGRRLDALQPEAASVEGGHPDGPPDGPDAALRESLRSLGYIR